MAILAAALCGSRAGAEEPAATPPDAVVQDATPARGSPLHRIEAALETADGWIAGGQSRKGLALLRELLPVAQAHGADTTPVRFLMAQALMRLRRHEEAAIILGALVAEQPAVDRYSRWNSRGYREKSKQSARGTAFLWSIRDTKRLTPKSDREPGGRLEAEIGYGVSAPGGHGVLTPYTGLSFSNDGERTYRLGGRWEIAPAFRMSLEGDRREHADHGSPEHLLMLRGAMRW